MPMIKETRTELVIHPVTQVTVSVQLATTEPRLYVFFAQYATRVADKLGGENVTASVDSSNENFSYVGTGGETVVTLAFTTQPKELDSKLYTLHDHLKRWEEAIDRPSDEEMNSLVDAHGKWLDHVNHLSQYVAELKEIGERDSDLDVDKLRQEIRDEITANIYSEYVGEKPRGKVEDTILLNQTIHSVYDKFGGGPWIGIGRPKGTLIPRTNKQGYVSGIHINWSDIEDSDPPYSSNAYITHMLHRYFLHALKGKTYIEEVVQNRLRAAISYYVELGRNNYGFRYDPSSSQLVTVNSVDYEKDGGIKEVMWTYTPNQLSTGWNEHKKSILKDR